jgi:hypothetical protein
MSFVCRIVKLPDARDAVPEVRDAWLLEQPSAIARTVTTPRTRRHISFGRALLTCAILPKVDGRIHRAQRNSYRSRGDGP